jgi:hypothetical protein
MPLVGDQDAVEQFAAEAADEAFGDRVGPRRPYRCPDDAGVERQGLGKVSCSCRQRVQHDTTGHRGRAGNPLYRARRTLRIRTALLTTGQRTRLEAVFADDAHAPVDVT